MASDSMKPAGLGVYIHWPFCAAICPYCDFNVHLFRDPDQSDWQRAYEKDIAHAAGLQPAGPVETVFFGGGTPSLMSPQTVGHVLAALDRHWGLAAGVEVSLEANPSSLPEAGLKDLQRAGVTRLSLGVQSLDDAALKFLGRTHDAAQAVRAFQAARAVFDHVSLDLIYARPGQTVSDWEHELGAALALQPDHLSAYQLTLEPDTPFYRLYEKGKLVPPPEDEQITLYRHTGVACAAAGLSGYEVSNYARDGHICRHNLRSWQGGDYAGIGPGAHGRLSLDGHRHATAGLRNPAAWLAQLAEKGHGLELCEKLSAEDAADEVLLFGLRLSEGVPMASLAARGVQISTEKKLFFIEQGLLQNRTDRLAATANGHLVLDRLTAELLSGR